MQGQYFLNSDYDEYLLSDINQDLVNLYRIVQRTPDKFIADARRFFTPEYNQAEKYYQLRKEFNASADPLL